MNPEAQAIIESLLSQMNGAAMAAARREVQMCAELATLREGLQRSAAVVEEMKKQLAAYAPPAAPPAESTKLVPLSAVPASA